MREFFAEIFADLPDAILSAASVAAFISMVAVWCVILGDDHRPSCKAGSVAALFTDCEVQQ